MKAFYTLIFMFLAGTAFAQSKLPTCKGDNYEQWNSCTGTINGNDGTAYEGDFANGQINGYGLLTLPTGEKVLGQFKNSVLSGRGLLVGKDGSRYAGEFDKNVFNGQGIFLLANGERKEGIFRNGQFVEAKKVTDAQILALLASQPVYSSIAVLTGKSETGKSNTSLAETTFEAGKVYHLVNKEAREPKETCVSSKWGKGSATGDNRTVREGIPLWGMGIYSNHAEEKREPGFFAYKNIEKGMFGAFFGGPVDVQDDSHWRQRAHYCYHLIATGEELNTLKLFNYIPSQLPNWLKIAHELTLAEAEKEWLNALGFKSFADYSNAATINWQMSGATYSMLSNNGISNIDQFNAASKRRSQCGGGEDSLQGLIAYFAEEAAAVKAGTPKDKYCVQRAAKAQEEKSKQQSALRRDELASPLLNCTKVNCTNSAEVESAVRDSWMRLKGKNSPYANNCFDAIKLVKDLRSAGRIFGPDTVTTAFVMCNIGLKELR